MVSDFDGFCMLLFPMFMGLSFRLIYSLTNEQQERSFEEVSKHKFGCRLMERLIEHLEPSQTAVIAEEIIPKAACFGSRNGWQHFQNFFLRQLLILLMVGRVSGKNTILYYILYIYKIHIF